MQCLSIPLSSLPSSTILNTLLSALPFPAATERKDRLRPAGVAPLLRTAVVIVVNIYIYMYMYPYVRLIHLYTKTPLLKRAVMSVVMHHVY